MENCPSWQGLPPDPARGPALLVFFLSLAGVCVALVGERTPALILGIPSACTLVLYACLRLLHSPRANAGFSLDDSARMLVPHSGGPIAFDAISCVRLVLYRDRACLHALRGVLRRPRALACVLRPGPEQDILHALRQRSLPVRVSRNPFSKRTADMLPLLVMPLLAAILLYAGVDMLRRLPVLAQPARELTTEPRAAAADERLHQVGPIAVCLPGRYRRIHAQDDSAVFLDGEDGTRIAISAGTARRTVTAQPLAQGLAGLLGFGNEHDAALLAVQSRFGLLPLMIKAALLKRYDPETVQIYRVHSGRLRGVLLSGEQARPDDGGPENMPDQVAEITLRRGSTGPVVRILSVSRLPLGIDFLGRMAAGIR